jgi:hypothetical protein
MLGKPGAEQYLLVMHAGGLACYGDAGDSQKQPRSACLLKTL